MARGEHRVRTNQLGLCRNGRRGITALARIIRHRVIRFISAAAVAIPRHSGESRATLHAGMLSRGHSRGGSIPHRQVALRPSKTSINRLQYLELRMWKAVFKRFMTAEHTEDSA